MKSESYPLVFIVAATLISAAAAICIVLLTYRPLVGPVLDVAPPFVIAIALALLLDPLIGWFQRKGLSRGLGVAIVGLSFLVVFLLVGLFLVPRIALQATQLSESFPKSLKSAQGLVDDLLKHHKPLLAKLHLPTTANALMSRFSVQLREAGSTGLNLLAAALGAMLSRLLWIVIIPVSTLWLLRDMDYIRAKVIHLTPLKHRDRLLGVASAVGGVFEKYVRGMSIVAILFSAVAMVILSVGGLEYGLIIGAVAGLLYLVPYVGVLILVLVMGVAGLAQPMNIAHVAVLMGILLVQSYLVFDMVVTPRIVGGSVGVHPVLALFALALGARLFGVVGMVVAYPVVASVQVALGELYPSIREKVVIGKPKEPQAEEST